MGLTNLDFDGARVLGVQGFRVSGATDLHLRLLESLGGLHGGSGYLTSNPSANCSCTYNPINYNPVRLLKGLLSGLELHFYLGYKYPESPSRALRQFFWVGWGVGGVEVAACGFAVRRFYGLH